MPYTTKLAVQNYLLTNIDASFDTQLAEWIDGVGLYMDGYCGCTLVNATPSTRLYDGNNDCSLKIDDVYDVTQVKVGDVVITPYLYPANSARKYLLKLQGDIFPTGMQNVSVAGTFGRFNELPADIKFAATVFVAGIVNQSNKQTDGIAQERVGEYHVVYMNQKERADFERAQQILDHYVKVSF